MPEQRRFQEVPCVENQVACEKIRINSLGFIGLNITQFLGALNDNVFKWLLVYLLIFIKGASVANLILTLSGAIFVTPFIIFSSLSGKLADNYSKTRILQICKLLEIFIMIAGAVAFSMKSEWASFFILFLMACHSTLFSPAKFGIFPELVSSNDIPAANGWISLMTNVAIIMGSFLAAWVTDISGYNFTYAAYVCIAIAIIGSLTSLAIPYSPSIGQKKRLRLSFWREIAHTLHLTGTIPSLRPILIANGLFYAIAGYCQLNIVTYAMVDMKLGQTAGGYLFPILAIGIGVGSLIAGKASKGQPRLDFLWKSSLGIALCYLAFYFTPYSTELTSACLFLLGVSAGFYVVTTDSFTQLQSPDEHRGEIIGTSNVLAFIGVLLGSLLIYLFGDLLLLTPKEGFVAVGLLTLLFSLGLHYAFRGAQCSVEKRSH